MRLLRTKGVCLLLSAALLGALSGCGSDDDKASKPASTDGAGQTLNVTMVADLTGQAAFAGLAVRAGAEVAVKEVNASGILGKNQLKLTVQDSGTDRSQAVQLVNKAARSDALAVMYTPMAPTAAAAAPVAQQQKLPFIEIAGDHPDLLETGDYVYHSSAPPDSYQGALAAYWAGHGVKTIGRVYNSDNTSFVSIIKDTWDKHAKEHGLSIVTSSKILTSDTDFASIAAEIADKAPDALMLGGLGQQFSTLVTQIRRAGYKGQIAGVSAGNIVYGLPEMGKLAEGMLFPADFSPAATSPEAKKFTAAFESDTGKTPHAFEAMGYDAVGMLAQAISEATELTRSGVKGGLDKVLAAGYDGAAGKVTFGPGSGGPRDAHVPGLVVQWKDGKEHVLDAPQ